MSNHSVIGLVALAMGIACVLAVASSIMIALQPTILLGSVTQASRFLAVVGVLGQIGAGILSVVSLIEKKKKTFCVAAIAFNVPFTLIFLGIIVYAVTEIGKH
jgi:hypothetical protein